nr:uncharacterized protein LOC109731357 isoform X2 [Microcebus murinus]
MAAGPPAAPAPFSLRPLLLPALRSRPLHSGPHPPSHLQPHAAAWFAQLVLDRWFPPAGRPWRPQRPGLGPQQPDPAAQGRKAAANHTQPHGLRLPSPAWSASPRGPCACAWLPPERGLEPQSQLQGRGQRRQRTVRSRRISPVCNKGSTFLTWDSGTMPGTSRPWETARCRGAGPALCGHRG